MIGEVTNAERASWAMAAVEGFRASHRSDGDLQTDIGDLITDLLHLARRECGVEDACHFVELKAAMHDTEVAEDPEQ